jgi:tetratricopeptide (TPR) repeat protein
MAAHTFVSRFSPNRTNPEVLEAIFVQRQNLAEIWVERLRDSVLTGIKHHLLAVGPRGCGKSHLVALIVNRLRYDPAVRERVRIAWLPEDETTSSFWKFLLRILRALHAHSEYGAEFPPPPKDQLANATDDRRTTVLTDYLVKRLEGRTLLVVVENLDEVMRGLADEGQKRWRAFLQEQPVAATLATAQQLTEDISDRDRPFFNFFQIEHLQPLSTDEAITLLRKIAELTEKRDLAAFLQTAPGRARVRAIRHLAGGNHRIFIILSEFATREKLDDLVTAFEASLDELTPYYQERLRWLPDQQREIVEFLCRQARTVPVKELAAELYLSDQTAAAQLKQLKDKGYVTAGSVGRESRYELAEPLMRLCVEVKDPEREPIRLIVEFLRIWYDRAGVEAQLQCLKADAGLERRYFQAVLQDLQLGVPGPLEAVLEQALDAARATGDPEEEVRVLVELAATVDSVEDCLAVAYQLRELRRYAEALTAYERAIVLNATNVAAWSGKSLVLHQLGRRDEALEACERGIELKPNDEVAWNNKAFVLNEIGRHAEAVVASRRTLDLRQDDPIAWHNLGYGLAKTGQYAEALIAYDRAIGLAPKVPVIWYHKGNALNDIGKNAEALAAYDRALQLDPKNAGTWIWRAVSLLNLGRVEEALEATERALGIDSNFVPAWNNKAYVLLRLRRFSESIAASERAIEIDPTYVSAWINKGFVLNELGRHAEALEPFDKAAKHAPQNPFIAHYRGRAKLGLGQLVAAVDDIRHAINLHDHYTSALESLAEAYVLQGNWPLATQTISHRFHSPSSPLDFAASWHLPDFIAAIFRTSAEKSVWTDRVSQLASIAAEAHDQMEKIGATEKQAPSPSHSDFAEVLETSNPFTLLGGSLVRSLTNKAYAQAPAEALNGWVRVWREASEHYPELSVASRLFEVGARFVQTKDERVLLDLVQEERLILRNLFDLDDTANERRFEA